jgi:hypothetical protein
MQEIVKALVASIEAKPSMLAGLPGEFWTRRAPPGVARPYAVIAIDGGDEPDYDTSERYLQSVSIRIHFVADYLADLTMVGTWRDALNYQPLTLSAGRVVAAKLVEDRFVDEPPPTDAGASCHHVLAFEFTQQQSHS